MPGVDTDVLTFERATKPYAAPVGMARDLYGAEQHDAPGSRTAVIAWDDYTTPAGLGLDASTGALAERGATRLEGLLSALPRRTEVSLFCHSYGSVLCGVAAPDLPRGRVRDITVLGSPGMRSDNVADLHTGAHVWAARDSGDWISDVPHLEFAGLGHGADPMSRAFGARLISAAGAVRPSRLLRARHRQPRQLRPDRAGAVRGGLLPPGGRPSCVGRPRWRSPARRRARSPAHGALSVAGPRLVAWPTSRSS